MKKTAATLILALGMMVVSFSNVFLLVCLLACFCWRRMVQHGISGGSQFKVLAFMCARTKKCSFSLPLVWVNAEWFWKDSDSDSSIWGHTALAIHGLHERGRSQGQSCMALAKKMGYDCLAGECAAQVGTPRVRRTWGRCSSGAQSSCGVSLCSTCTRWGCPQLNARTNSDYTVLNIDL